MKRAARRVLAFVLASTLPAPGLAGVGVAASAGVVGPPLVSTVAPTAKQLYETARREEARLRRSPREMRSIDAWTAAARRYRAVVVAYPRSGYCDDALYHEGNLYRDAAERFGGRALAVRAGDAYALLARGYPSSRWVPSALLEQARLFAGPLADAAGARRAIEALRKAAPRSDELESAETLLAPPPAPPPREAPAPDPPEAQPAAPADPTPREAPPEPANPPGTVNNVRHWVGDSHTRVVLDLSRAVPYTEGRLTGPDRVFFDLHGASLAEDLANREFPISGSHLQRIRAANHDVGVVRVVLDLSSIREVSVFALPDPYRLVVDVHGAPTEAEEAPTEVEAPDVAAATNPPTDPAPGGKAVVEAPGEARVDAGGVPAPTDSGYSLARQLGARVRRIVLDAGHGGKDPGTRAGRLREKDIALDVAGRVRTLLVEDGFEVVMTRDKDVFIPLEKRAFIANDARADLFLSIHANAARNRRARGLETFYLNLATSPDAEEVAARENATANVRMSDMPRLLEKIMNNNRVAESAELAEAMQKSLAESILGKAGHALDRGVKTAGFHVLLGAQMPAVLIEVGFVSNREEAKLLSAGTHRAKIAQAIADGVTSYLASLGQPASETAAGSPAPGR